MSLTRLAHSLVNDHFLDKEKGLAVDATCGNGHDTEFLARQGFAQIIGFDIQTQAINNTQKRIASGRFTNVTLHQQSHEYLSHFICNPISCAMFNFGYLPNADKSITTQSASSLNALNQILEHLDPNGLLCMICYPGHKEGIIETKNVRHWLTQLNDHWDIKEHTSNSPKPEAPVLFTVTAKR